MPRYMKSNAASEPLSAVLFDLDDTLIDSFDARVAALTDAFQGAGLRHLDPKQFFHEIRGRQLLDELTELEEREGEKLGLVERYRHAYWNRKPGLISMYPGIGPLLEALHKR
ncbi:MAG: HAD hydrolase-like protein, partial [Chloroflexi bacterium]|nr:HAD hydrolase-like protein [Chloroflexota bacterium]